MFRFLIEFVIFEGFNIYMWLVDVIYIEFVVID